MDIEKFELSTNKTYIDVELSSSDIIEDIYLLDKDHRSKGVAFNLAKKIENGETSFTISLSDLNISKFSGIYVLDIYTNDGGTYKELLLETSAYEGCLLERVLALHICDDCIKKNDTSLVNAFNLLTSLKIAVNLGAYNEAFVLSNGLDKYCKTECRECGNY